MAEYALGDARRPFDLYDTEELRIQKSEEERRQLAAVVEKWPPAVDGYCFVSQKEVDAVVQLRQSLSDLEEDCAWASLNVKDVRILLCFCRARKLEVKKAEKMWRETHAWRKHVEPVQALRGYVLPLVLDKYGTGGQFGLDREGCPVFYDPVANIDPVSLLRNTTDDELLESEMMKLEMLQALLDRRVVETGTLHSGCTIVIDIRNLGRHHLNKAGLHALKLILEQNDKNYPERAKRILVINAPMIFGLIWGIVQYFLDPVTREKVQIFSHTPKEVMLKYIDEEQLWEEYGGRRDRCDVVRFGGVVPKNFKDEFHDSFSGHAHED